MLTIFNRRLLLVLYSQEKLDAVKTALHDAGISFFIGFGVPTGRMSRHARGTGFTDMDAAYEYRLYVHRNDYEHACKAIDRIL